MQNIICFPKLSPLYSSCGPVVQSGGMQTPGLVKVWKNNLFQIVGLVRIVRMASLARNAENAWHGKKDGIVT